MDDQISGDLADGSPQFEATNNLSDVQDVFPPAGHAQVSFPAAKGRTGEATRDVDPGKRKREGWYTEPENARYTQPENGWYTEPENRWYTDPEHGGTL
jgi:hypothetical protein